MNENVNSPAKWLQYLLYVGIAAMANSLLSVFLPGRLTTWIGYAASAASVFLFFQLIGANARYKTAALFTGVYLVISVLNIAVLSLAASICALVGQYQEYHAHGELIAERDPKLADKWSSLFWFQFAVSVILVLLISVLVGVLAAAANLDLTVVTSISTLVAAVLTVVLKVLYLVYLNRTIKAVSDEFVA